MAKRGKSDNKQELTDWFQDLEKRPQIYYKGKDWWRVMMPPAGSGKVRDSNIRRTRFTGQYPGVIAIVILAIAVIAIIIMENPAGQLLAAIVGLFLFFYFTYASYENSIHPVHKHHDEN